MTSQLCLWNSTGASRRQFGPTSDYGQILNDGALRESLSALPAPTEIVALYLCHIAHLYKLSSLNNILSAIAYFHRLKGIRFDRNPLKPVLKGIGRVHGGATLKKPAIELDYLHTLVNRFPKHKRGLRDRAIFMIGFCAGLRCEELTRLDYNEFGGGAISCVRIGRDGARIEMRYRGDAVKRARMVWKFIGRQSEFCPVKALEDWIAGAKITRGPLFRAIDKHGRIGETRLLRNNMSVILRRALRDAEVALGRIPLRQQKLRGLIRFIRSGSASSKARSRRVQSRSGSLCTWAGRARNAWNNTGVGIRQCGVIHCCPSWPRQAVH